MDDWEKFNETSSPEKEDFYCHLNMKDITCGLHTCKKSLKIKLLQTFKQILKQGTMHYWTHGNDCSIILQKSNFGPNLTF